MAITNDNKGLLSHKGQASRSLDGRRSERRPRQTHVLDLNIFKKGCDTAKARDISPTRAMRPILPKLNIAVRPMEVPLPSFVTPPREYDNPLDAVGTRLKALNALGTRLGAGPYDAVPKPPPPPPSTPMEGSSAFAPFGAEAGKEALMRLFEADKASLAAGQMPAPIGHVLKVQGATLTQLKDGTFVIYCSQRLPLNKLDVQHYLTRGQTPWALRLQKGPQGDIVGVDNRKKVFSVKDGIYGFVLDTHQNVQVHRQPAALSPKTSDDENRAHAPRGAHLSVVSGAGVLFAGELRVEKGRIVAFNRRSGNYLTPSFCMAQAQQHPLLKDAEVEDID